VSFQQLDFEKKAPQGMAGFCMAQEPPLLVYASAQETHIQSCLKKAIALDA